MAKFYIVGGATIDICGKSLNKLVLRDSNIADIRLSIGGVGRNIASGLAALKQEIQFVTCFAEDEFAQLIKEDFKKKGIHLDYSKSVPNEKSSMYLAILDDENDMYIGMNDMKVLEHLDYAMLDRVLQDITEEDFLIIDSNLDEAHIQYMVERCKGRIAADPVSVAKAKKLSGVLKSLTFFKPNEYEATSFTNVVIKDEVSAKQSLQWFLDEGVKEVAISLAGRGVLLGTKELKVWIHQRGIQLKNATGGGDAFMATYLAKRLEGYQEIDAACYAIYAAVKTIEGTPLDMVELNAELSEIISDMEIKILEL